MEYIVIALVIVVVMAFVAYPLFAAPEEKTAPMPEALDGLIAQRDSAYDAIRDLDLDYQLGKLSQNDYHALREKYKLRAASALQQIDALPGREGADERIEEEVARLRRHVRPEPNGDTVEREVARLRAKTSAPTNGDAIEHEVARLRARRRPAQAKSAPMEPSVPVEPSPSAPQRACAACGAPYHAGDRFCAKCGAALAE